MDCILQDRKQLLQQWVSSNGNAQSIEADLVLSKSRANKHQSKRELLTTAEMQRREIPLEKIRAIVAKGNGVADPDCPHLASLTRFWVSTSVTETDTDEVKQEATLRMQADAASTIAVLGASASPSSASSALGADGMQQILQSLQAASAEEPGLYPFFCWHFFSLGCMVHMLNFVPALLTTNPNRELGKHICI